MKKKRIMIVGPRESGKTSLANRINNYSGDIKRTPSIIYDKETIEIPGAYLESPWSRKNIITTQQDAYLAIFISDPSIKKNIYPPNFAESFRIPVIGVISKIDLDNINIEKSVLELENAGCKEIRKLSLIDEKSLDLFCSYLSSSKK